METSEFVRTPRILLAEDDQNLGTILSEYMQAKGFACTLVKNGVEGWNLFRSEPFDCCVLDVMMPEKDGFTLARDIRAMNATVPILFLTAKSMKDDAITGFKTGADDYITKPFSMEELLLRIRAILRRSVDVVKQRESVVYQFGNFTFDFKNQVLIIDGHQQHLTSKETALIKLMASSPNTLIDRSKALRTVWGDDSYFNSRSMDVYIAKIRKYLKADERVRIVNEHGRGFRFEVPESGVI